MQSRSRSPVINGISGVSPLSHLNNIFSDDVYLSEPWHDDIFLNEPEDDEEKSTWRLKDRMKTAGVALVLCLNLGTDPPDVVKPTPCARRECWFDPTGPKQKGLEVIGNALQQQYERWQSKAKYKQCLDPTSEDLRRLCINLRKVAKNDRLLLHYNGHGVPRPTKNGELWVFGKHYTHYMPVSIFELRAWLGDPSIYVIDCSGAGALMPYFMDLTTPFGGMLRVPSTTGAGPSSTGGGVGGGGGGATGEYPSQRTNAAAAATTTPQQTHSSGASNQSPSGPAQPSPFPFSPQYTPQAGQVYPIIVYLLEHTSYHTFHHTLLAHPNLPTLTYPPYLTHSLTRYYPIDASLGLSNDRADL